MILIIAFTIVLIIIIIFAIEFIFTNYITNVAAIIIVFEY